MVSKEELYPRGDFVLLRLRDLTTDGRFNRPVSDNSVNRMASAYDPDAFGVITVWHRGEEYVILDGQHRVELLRFLGIPETAEVIPGRVLEDLTLEQAAEKFVTLNANRLVTAYEKFVALRTAGHRPTLHLDGVVKSVGLSVQRTAGDGAVSCVEAVQAVYRLGEPEGAVLELALSTLHQAWGPVSEAYRAVIIRGVGLYCHEHRNVDSTHLADCLVRRPGAPINLLGWAKNLAGTQTMTLDRAIAEVIEKLVLRPPRRKPKAVQNA